MGHGDEFRPLHQAIITKLPKISQIHYLPQKKKTLSNLSYESETWDQKPNESHVQHFFTWKNVLPSAEPMKFGS